MEDYIETFLYILFTIIFIIVGSLGKKRRGTQRPVKETINDEYQPQQEYKKTPNIFDYLQEQFTDKQDQIIEEDQIPPAEEEPIVENEPEKMVEIVEQQTSLKPELTNYLDDEEIGIDFDLRKAVIYSEILNRKSY